MESVHAKEESKRLRTQLTEQRDRLNDLDAKNAALMRELELLRREKEERERELESENSEFKMEIAKLRAEMEAILKELQTIMDTKLGLELEIAAYRKLLEGEESRQGLRQIVESLSGTQEHRMDSQMAYSSYGSHGGASSSSSMGLGGHGGLDSGTTTRVSQVMKGEMSAKTTYQRSAKGPISISECAQDGKFVAIENTGRKEENLDGFRIRRNIDGSDRADFPLDYITVQPMAKIKIWAAGCKPPGAPTTDLEYHGDWGTGSAIKTTLINQLGEDRATHVQKTVYS
jgi:intermediate filament protein if